MKKRLMAITFAALMATSMMGSTVFAATDGGSVAGKTSLADADFDTDYQPQKDEYKIYCTYKNIHSWYDAIKTGVDAAVADLKDKGVTIDYEWYGPAQPDAVDQVNSIETAVGQGYDLIAVDVNQADTTAKAIDTAVDAGVKVATFGTVDVPDCKRSFFVGNDDPYGDGEALAKAVCEKMGGKVTGSVTKKTNYLINNDVESASSKNRRAKELGVPIISEEEFIELAGVEIE